MGFGRSPKVPTFSHESIFRDSGVARGQGDDCPPCRNSAPPLAPQWNNTLYRGLCRAAILSPSQLPLHSPLSPPCRPSFWKVWLRPCSEICMIFYASFCRFMLQFVDLRYYSIFHILIANNVSFHLWSMHKHDKLHQYTKIARANF